MQMEHNLSTSSSNKVRLIVSVKIAAFTALLLILVLFLETLLQSGGSVIERKRKIDSIEANSVDVMFIGNSHAYCTFDPAVIEPIIGKRVFNAGLPDQKIDMVYYTLRDMLKRQNPETIILEAYAFGRSDSSYEGYVANIDAMRPGIRKVMACFEIFPDKLEALKMSIGLFRCHNNWKKTDIMEANLRNLSGRAKVDVSNFNGFFALDSKMSEETIEKYKEKTDIKFVPEVNAYSIRFFKRIVRICKESNIRLIVTAAPFNDIYAANVHYENFYEQIMGLCDEEGVSYVDFNMLYDEIGLEYDDFEDACHHAQHLNKWGAEKVSKYMAEYLRDSMEFTKQP